MADKAEKKAKTNIFTTVWAAICRFFGAIGKVFANMWRELKKVTWPTREKLVRYSAIVVAFIVFMMVVIGLLDWGASKLVEVLAGVRSTSVVETVPVEETSVVETTSEEVETPAEEENTDVAETPAEDGQTVTEETPAEEETPVEE